MTIIVTEAEHALITEALARYENDDDGAADALYRRLTADEYAVHHLGFGWAVGNGTSWVVAGLRSKAEAEDISAACKAGDFSVATAIKISKKHNTH